eukprot:TRINITY_DN951_c0_g1_i1.p1 TRINITY_DN951_c0_g1~~TRINITY_DN951_c0_g1_i1.p1  ORF type:complete len:591 (-),score=75.97 TRINITY_DN951_c0_g1_i1:213-1772(-)
MGGQESRLAGQESGERDPELYPHRGSQTYGVGSGGGAASISSRSSNDGGSYDNFSDLGSHNRPASSARPTSGDHSNPIDEIQLLECHTDIVRFLVRIDNLRIASASDDGTVVVWNTLTGKKHLVLRGHTKPITCLLLLTSAVMATGSSDKTIRLWNLNTGACIKLLTEHSGAVTCLVAVSEMSLFLSGGNDRNICLWQTNGKLLGSIERQEEENLHCMLSVGSGDQKRVVTGSNSSLLLVYSLTTLRFDKLLAYHRESVRCLERVSDQLFASGSLDGAIVVWDSDSLTMLKLLNYPDPYRDMNRVYVYSVRKLRMLGQRYLAAAIGDGFGIYDVVTGECVLMCESAHDSEVVDIVVLYQGTRFITCSVDSSLKLWGLPERILFDFRSKQPWSDVTDAVRRARDGSRSRINTILSTIPPPLYLEAVCLGEMSCHSECAHCLLTLSETSFVSCGADSLVVVWKDGRVQRELRNKFSGASIPDSSSTSSTSTNVPLSSPLHSPPSVTCSCLFDTKPALEGCT